jgi:hypothetical protein
MHFFLWPRAVLAIVLSALILGACGGGGGSSGGHPNAPAAGSGTAPTTPTPTEGSGDPPAPVPANIELFASSETLSAAPTSTVTFTIFAKDADNRAIAGQAIAVSASSGVLGGTNPTPRTGAKGEPVTGVFLNPGQDLSNRDVVVTAHAGQVTRSMTLRVQGARIDVGGANSVILGNTGKLTVDARDADGNRIAGVPLVVSSRLGNPVSPSVVTTRPDALSEVTIYGAVDGLDEVTFTGLGSRAVRQVSVSRNRLSFQPALDGSQVRVEESKAVAVQLLGADQSPLAGVTVDWSTTRGTLSVARATTDPAGMARTTVVSTTSGPATVTAGIPDGTQVSGTLEFLAGAPAQVLLQASPASVVPNLEGSRASLATLRASVSDHLGNPVSGAQVRFSADPDPSQGTVDPPVGVTNTGGIAASQFFPGIQSTAPGGVQLQAATSGGAVVGRAELTVNGRALFLSVVTGNEIRNANENIYSKSFTVYVVDSAGNPVANQPVTLSVDPTHYGKGRLAWSGKSWSVADGASSCPNEDKNRDGLLDPGEDANGDGRLTPQGPASIQPRQVTTDSSGRAGFTLEYGEDRVPWVLVRIIARATVVGTESSGIALFELSGAASDFNSEQTPPAGVISPYGVGGCSDPF